jgi:hypothetical protein
VRWFRKQQAEASTESDHVDLPCLSARGRSLGSVMSVSLRHSLIILYEEALFLCARSRQKVGYGAFAIDEVALHTVLTLAQCSWSIGELLKD